MRGYVVFHDLKFAWELDEEPSQRAGPESAARGPQQCTLQVRFGDLCVARRYATPLTEAQAAQEAMRLAPDVLRLD